MMFDGMGPFNMTSHQLPSRRKSKRLMLNTALTKQILALNNEVHRGLNSYTRTQTLIAIKKLRNFKF